jgi:predicted HTH transcriptional regulator
MNKDLPSLPGQYYIKNLIAQGENQQLDFKFSISDANKIARTLVAFANTDGGKLLIGVKDNGSIAGIRSEEEIYMIDNASNLFCKPSVPYSVKKWIVDGKQVLEIEVKKSNQLHYVKDQNGKWLVYIRNKDQNILANWIYIQYLKKKESQKGIMLEYKEAEKKLISYLSENKNATFGKIKKTVQLTYHDTEVLLINLLCMDIIDINITIKGAFYNLKKVND